MMFVHKKVAFSFVMLILSAIVFLSAQSGTKHSSKPKVTPKRNSKPLEVDGKPLFVAVIRDDVLFQKKPLDLWSSYYIYGETDDEYFLGLPAQKSYELLLETRLSWINKANLLDSPEALRTENKIYRRIIVFDNKYESRVPVYCSPKEDAAERCKTPMYSFFYIYKETQDYYLIGISPTVDLEYSGDDILGWIHRKSCREWNTRLAISYSEKTRDQRIKSELSTKQGMVEIYKELEDAKQQTTGGVIAKESDRTLWYYNMPRYPLLKSLSYNEKRIFEIAFLGGQMNEVIQQSISKLREEKNRLNKLDVMFVVDGSADTQIIRQKILEAVETVNKYLLSRNPKQKNLMDVCYGITFYRDFTKGQTYRYYRGRLFEPKVVHIFPFTNDVAKFTQDINNEPFQGEKDAIKCMFYGIDMAMHNKADWRPGSTRCMIVVGSAGNYEKKSPDDITKLTMDEIVLAMQRKKIRPYAVQFLPSDNKMPLTYTAFYEQMSQIIKSAGEGGYFPLPMSASSSDKATSENEKKVDWSMEKILQKLIEHYEQEVKIFQNTLGDVERGFTPQEINERQGKTWDTAWSQTAKNTEDMYKTMPVQPEIPKAFLQPASLTTLLESFLNAYGIRVEDLKGSGGFFDHGWVWEFHPTTNLQQIQVSLLIDQLELSRIGGFLSSLNTSLKKASRPEEYTEVWKTLLKVTFGIDTIPPNEPLDNLIMQHSGLPFMNGILHYTLEDFVKNSRGSAFRQFIADKLENTSNRLFEIIQEKEVEVVPVDDGTTYTRTKKRWWTEEGNEMKYAWIEIEVFP